MRFKKTTIAIQLSSLLGATIFGVPSTVLAQSGTEAQSSVLEEIIVTAQRRSENIQDVPISITAISGDLIEQVGIESPVELFAQVPNVTSQLPTSGTGFPIFNIRGVTLLDFTDTNEASVAMYVDDVYLGSPAIQNGQLFDISRVEILRGPQGTLYGKNATGGVVNFISRRPTEELEGYIRAQYASYDDITVEGAVSGSLTDNVRARLSLFGNERDSWQDNEAINGSDFGDIDENNAVRLTVEIDVTEDLLITGNLHYGNAEGDVDQRAFFGAADPNNGLRCSDRAILASQCVNPIGFQDPDPDPEHVSTDLDESPFENENMGGWLRFDWDVSDMTFTSITSYDEVDKVHMLDVDQSPWELLDLVFAIDHEQWSQEFRLAGDSESLSWVVGAYYYEDERFATNTLPNRGGFGVHVDQEVESSAVFGQGTMALSDALNVTVGVRYTRDDRVLNNLTAVLGGEPGTDAGDPQYTVEDDIDSSKTTWRLAFDYALSDEHMAYASVSTGYKSGAFNTLLPSSPASVTAADPEEITAYELGLKGTLDGEFPLTYNAAIFYSDYENVQAAGSFIEDGVVISALETVSDAEIFGFEAELTANPLEGLIIALGVGYLDAEYDAPSDATFNGTLIDGNRVVMAPDWNFNGRIRYDHGLNDAGIVYLMTDFNWQDDLFFGPDNLPLETQDSYGKINFHAGWISDDERWEVGAFVKNATDEEYFTHAVDSNNPADVDGTQLGYTWGMPRTYGVNVTMQF